MSTIYRISYTHTSTDIIIIIILYIRNIIYRKWAVLGRTMTIQVYIDIQNSCIVATESMRHMTAEKERKKNGTAEWECANNNNNWNKQTTAVKRMKYSY